MAKKEMIIAILIGLGIITMSCSINKFIYRGNNMKRV